MYRIATRAVMVSKSAWKIDANCAARPLVVEVPLIVDDPAVIPFVTLSDVAVAFATFKLPPVIVPDV